MEEWAKECVCYHGQNAPGPDTHACGCFGVDIGCLLRGLKDTMTLLDPCH